MIKELQKQDITNRALIKLRAIFILFGIIFLFTNIVFAASLPIPARTEVIREEVVEQGGEEYKIVFCESKLSPEKVNSFYEKKLPALGYSLLFNTDKMKMYKKEGKTFMVVVSINPEGKTNIVLTQGGGFAAIGKAAQSRTTPDCEDFPDVPVYPGARCMASTRMRNMQATAQRFSVAADAYRIVDFYRKEMPRYGWYIDKEVDAPQSLADSGMPDVDLSGLEQIFFKNNQGADCVITVMPSITGDGSTMNIMYNESKR